MTYGSFLLVFLVVPAALFAWLLRPAWRPLLRALLPLLLIVYATATPWDNFAAASGLWTFDPEKISGLRLWHLPIEEYGFFGLQTLLTGMWVSRRLERLS